jgi:hypothetical protein
MYLFYNLKPMHLGIDSLKMLEWSVFKTSIRNFHNALDFRIHTKAFLNFDFSQFAYFYINMMIYSSKTNITMC